MIFLNMTRDDLTLDQKRDEAETTKVFDRENGLGAKHLIVCDQMLNSATAIEAMTLNLARAASERLVRIEAQNDDRCGGRRSAGRTTLARPGAHG
jgi:hypothetical protein